MLPLNRKFFIYSEWRSTYSAKETTPCVKHQGVAYKRLKTMENCITIRPKRGQGCLWEVIGCER